MDNSLNDKQDFTTGSISKKMIQFMFPILGALILQSMYSAVDLLIVGKFGTTAGISGVSTGSGILSLFTFTIASLSTGVTVIIGRYLGEGQNHKIGKLLGSAVVFFAILSVVLAILMYVLARPLALLMQAPPEALELTITYIRICAVGFVFVVFYNFISSIMRGIGDSKSPMIFVSIACVINIVGDLVLVAGFHMNVAGAAIATIAAQAVSVILSLIIIMRQKLPFTITREDFRLSGEVFSALKIGAPLSLQEVLTHLSFLALCAFVNRLGLACSSGYGVAQKVQSFFMLIPSSIMQSMAPIVAQNVGAGQHGRCRKALRISQGLGASIGIVVAVSAFMWGDAMASLFTNDSVVIQRAFEYLRGFAPDIVLTCVMFSYIGYFNAHSKSFFVMLQGMAQSFLIRLPLSYYMSVAHSDSLYGIGSAAPVATVFGIILCFIYDACLEKQYKSE